MPIIRNEYNEKSKGGTELSIAELEKYVGEEALADFQIIPSRFRGLKEGLIPIYWVHDTENDPEMDHLKNGGWRKFAMLVFVSNWQMQRFIEKFQIPWSRCFVLPNAVEPFEKPIWLDNASTLNFIYHTTPHRGLSVLAAAFEKLSQEEDVHLDVYSSFSIYGWTERDAQFEPLYNRLRSNPKVTYHGAVPNSEVREALIHNHGFVYPCIWPETGCRALIEAMCAGTLSTTTNYGCLYETAGTLASTYQMQDDLNVLAGDTYGIMKGLVQGIRGLTATTFNTMREDLHMRANGNFSWIRRAEQWKSLLNLVRSGWNG